MKPYDDLEFVDVKHPLINELENDILQHQPINVLLHIKKWAKNKLREDRMSSEEEEALQLEKKEVKNKDRTQYKNRPQLQPQPAAYRRRNAIFMTSTFISFDEGLMSLKQTLPKNEECRSRIMITLRSIPFLTCLSWEDIYKLVEMAKVRQYYQGQHFVKAGQLSNYLYIIIEGQVMRQQSSHNNRAISSKKYIQGDPICEQSIISLSPSDCTYEIASEKAILASIQSFAIHEISLQCCMKREELVEKCLMNVGLFAALDLQEMYKLTLMVKEVDFKADDVIVHMGERMSVMYFIMEGEFSKCKVNLSGEIVSYKVMAVGEYFGDQWIIDSKGESQYAVICKSDGKLGSILKQDIQKGISRIDRILQRKKRKPK